MSVSCSSAQTLRKATMKNYIEIDIQVFMEVYHGADWEEVLSFNGKVKWHFQRHFKEPLSQPKIDQN